jgi:hypothetical protein
MIARFTLSTISFIGCSMSKARHLALVGGTAAGDAEPPDDSVDAPHALALKMLADRPVICLLGWADEDGTPHTISNLGDKFEELVFLRQLQKVIEDHEDDCA